MRRVVFWIAATGFLAFLMTAAGAPPTTAQGLAGLKIGVVRMNTALNNSDAGERSKKFLLSSKSQKEDELKAKEQALKKSVDDLKSNIMLSAAARSEREKELKDQEDQLRREVQQAQRELQEQERRLTETIFTQLRTVIANIAKDKRYDIVLEQGASQVVLYSKVPFDDITDLVIQRFNEMQGGQQ